MLASQKLHVNLSFKRNKDKHVPDHRHTQLDAELAERKDMEAVMKRIRSWKNLSILSRNAEHFPQRKVSPES